MWECGSLLSGNNGNVNSCVYAVELDEDCRTTVWTYGKDGKDGILDSFQPDEQLKKEKKISYVRTRHDVYKTLGPGSVSESASILAFGSLFTSPYKGSELHIDIHEAPRDQRMLSLIENVRFLTFVPEITNSGKDFVYEKIKSPFLCAQLRLLDGQFKNHWKSTFLRLQEKMEYLRNEGVPLPIHIFVMIDLPGVIRTAKKLGDAGMKKHCHPPLLPDILLYIEDTVCSCAKLCFVGTAGSTIAESTELMRKYGVCSSRGTSGDTPVESHDFFVVNPPQVEARTTNPLPAPSALDEECESMDPSNSNDGEQVPQKPDSLQCCYPFVIPAYIPQFFPFSVPFWPGHVVEPVKTETHEVLKPTAVHSKSPINVDELVGMSKLSLGKSIGNAEPFPLSLKLLEGSNRHFAFHPNPAPSGSSRVDSSCNPKHAV
ncbi:hypothetical protein Vadar_030459 [Vaccinium darrowii]|uniref:Uncharacterized protein n=1 Tax=Vaccinium darrowii TaxID=229202 RepID=A0ACB7X562_9ERIC|nr:hypothetical protein Vadar_030459 [Vaccinium darrowii]